MVTVVKRRGKIEPFDKEKIYNSIYSTCQHCDLSEDESAKIAEKVSSDVEIFFKDRDQINSTEIFGFIIQKLAKEHEAVAFMYQTHREIHDV